jgi:hypothetical protein
MSSFSFDHMQNEIFDMLESGELVSSVLIDWHKAHEKNLQAIDTLQKEPLLCKRRVVRSSLNETIEKAKWFLTESRPMWEDMGIPQSLLNEWKSQVAEATKASVAIAKIDAEMAVSQTAQEETPN